MVEPYGGKTGALVDIVKNKLEHHLAMMDTRRASQFSVNGIYQVQRSQKLDSSRMASATKRTHSIITAVEKRNWEGRHAKGNN